MGLFGKLDAANIPTNPFFVAKGDYSAEVVASRYQVKPDGTKQFYIQYEITNEDSEYLGKKPTRIYDLVDENMTEKDFELLPSDEKNKIRNRMSSLKRDLCGNTANAYQKGLGVSLEDVNDPDWNPETIVGTKVNIGITNYGPDNEGVNIRWVNLAQE